MLDQRVVAAGPADFHFLNPPLFTKKLETGFYFFNN